MHLRRSVMCVLMLGPALIAESIHTKPHRSMQAKTLRLRMRDVGLAQNAVPSTAELQLELSTRPSLGIVERCEVTVEGR